VDPEYLSEGGISMGAGRYTSQRSRTNNQRGAGAESNLSPIQGDVHG